MDEIRAECEKLGKEPRGWWQAIDSSIDKYTSPEDVEGWFLTERPREVVS